MIKESSFLGLENKIALITGGGTGLGLAMAKSFVDQGAKVIITGRREDVLKEACQNLGSNAWYEVLDVTDFGQIPSRVSAMEAKYGSIDILVNNAGIHIKKSIFDYSNDDFHKVIATNEEAVFVLTREVSLKMSQRHAGVVLMISSMASQYGIPKVIGYTAAKSAIEGMTRAMAVELSPLGIRVNCIAPGFIRTSMSSSALDSDPERKAKVLGRTPMGDLGLPEDVANAAVFLCSHAAKYITGVVLPVDGGNSIGF
jgi:NAD(P)-dependent dehydrogenase (short-subunit alcohol dehydrogenase family)